MISCMFGISPIIIGDRVEVGKAGLKNNEGVGDGNRNKEVVANIIHSAIPYLTLPYFTLLYFIRNDRE